jgi:hypothetical protein
MARARGPSWHDPWWEMTTFSGGRRVEVTLSDPFEATKNGEYMAAVGQALDSNKPSYLAPFEGDGVTDADGRLWPFETRINVLYRLSQGPELFEMVYRIVT